MAQRLPIFKAKDVVRILKQLGFFEVRQKGHIFVLSILTAGLLWCRATTARILVAVFYAKFSGKLIFPRKNFQNFWMKNPNYPARQYVIIPINKKMRKPEFASKKSVLRTAYWKHPRKLGKRSANKSERQGIKCKLSPILISTAPNFQIC